MSRVGGTSSARETSGVSGTSGVGRATSGAVGTSSAAPTLADFPRRRNSLNALRLGLAVLVIVSHAWPIGRFGPDPKIGDLTLGTFSVAGFFAISGWLITESRMNGTLPAFAWRRAVRIYPGFLVALLVVGFGYAPVAAWLADRPYSPVDGIRYVSGNLIVHISEWTVGRTLPPSAYPAWNGALWSLWPEVWCYILVGLVVSMLGRRRSSDAIIVLFAGTTLWALAADLLAPLTPGMFVDTLNVLPFYFAGAALYVLRAQIPLTNGVAAGAAALCGAGLALDVHRCAFAPAIAYLMLWAGARLPLTGVGTRHDLSYGIYIYGFPTQQLLAVAGVPALLGVGGYVTASVLATLPVAAASWLLVERPAQRLRGLLDPRPALSGTRLLGHNGRRVLSAQFGHVANRLLTDATRAGHSPIDGTTAPWPTSPTASRLSSGAAPSPNTCAVPRSRSCVPSATST